MFKSQAFKEDYEYPSNWDDDDKFRFDFLMMESKRLYPNMEDWMIKLCVHSQVNNEKGLTTELSLEEEEEFKKHLEDDGVREYFTEPIEEAIESKNLILVNN